MIWRMWLMTQEPVTLGGKWFPGKQGLPLILQNDFCSTGLVQAQARDTSNQMCTIHRLYLLRRTCQAQQHKPANSSRCKLAFLYMLANSCCRLQERGSWHYLSELPYPKSKIVTQASFTVSHHVPNGWNVLDCYIMTSLSVFPLHIYSITTTWFRNGPKHYSNRVRGSWEND